MGKHFMTNVVFFLLLITSSLFSMEQDTKESKITVGDFSSRIPKEVFLRICATPTIKYRYPWKAIKPIFQLRLVCKVWRSLILEHQEYIATLLDISLMHWYAATGNTEKIIACKVCEKCSVKEPDKEMFSPSECAFGAQQKKSWEILKIGSALKLKEGQVLSAGFSDSTTPEHEYTVQDIIDALHSNSPVPWDAILSIVTQSEATWVPLLREIGWTQSAPQSSLLNPMCQLHLLYALQCKIENRLLEHIHTGAKFPEIFWEIFKKVNANPNAYDFEGFTALHRACRTPEKSWLVGELLKQDGVDVNCRSKCGSELTPLHITVLYRNPNHKALEALLATKKCMVNTSSPELGTALHCAANQNDSVAVKLLIDHKADIYSKNEGCANVTPIHFAASHENTDSLAYLVATPTCQLEVKNDDGCTPLWYAVRSDSSDCMRYLLCKGAKINDVTISGGKTLLQYAVGTDSKQCFPILPAQLGDAINRTDKVGQGAVHYAARSDTAHFIEPLVNARALVNLVDANGDTPIHVAAYEGHTEAVKALVKCNADTTAQTKLGKKALDIAEEHGYTGIVELLKERE
jgi:ankyrin repeat protein